MNLALGKQPHKHDARTAQLGDFISLPIVPTIHDFDRGRRSLPLEVWGNDEWGDCVEAGKYNGLLRLERIEERVTIPVTATDVVESYRAECLIQNGTLPSQPGDSSDTGLVMLDSLGRWRTQGLSVAAKKRSYKIAAYGALNHNSGDELRAANFLLDGIYFGVNLPLSAHRQITAHQDWDAVDGPDGEPGSWGGHCVYSKRYDSGGFYVLTWGTEQYMTNRFVAKYCDECWAVVDALDKSKPSRYLDVQKLYNYLKQIGASNIAG